MEAIKQSELILNPDGSVYHINLKPEHITDDIIFVGDPKRIDEVASFFDEIVFETEKREFRTKIGCYKGKKITVISTGIGPDNIDIVLNELDALVNIDFETRKIKSELRSLNIYRLGTSGALQSDIPVDVTLVSTHGIGIDNMMRSYALGDMNDVFLENEFIKHTDWNLEKGKPYAFACSEKLLKKFANLTSHKGITITAGGFYGAQGRILRLQPENIHINEQLETFSIDGLKATNFEMETAAIYGLSKLLGHHALSINTIIANRANGAFSNDPYQAVRNMIKQFLDMLVNE